MQGLVMGLFLMTTGLGNYVSEAILKLVQAITGTEPPGKVEPFMIWYKYIYSTSMKTQHLYFRYLSNMELSIKFLFSLDNCTLHMLSKDYFLYWLIVNMHCLKVLGQKQVIWLPAMFRMSDFYFCIVICDWVDYNFPTSKCRYVFSISRYLKIKSKKMWTIFELVAAVRRKVVICPVFEPLLHFVCTWHWY